MTHSHVALLLSCCLLVLALASAEWSTVPLASTADGYDNHDDGGPSQSWIAVLQCEPSATHVHLKGNVQCKSGNQNCWTTPTVFATLPPQCRPESDTLTSPAQLRGDPEGYKLTGPDLPVLVRADGTMELSKASDGTHWSLQFDGPPLVSFDKQLRDEVSWAAVLSIFLCAAIYVGGGVYVGKAAGCTYDGTALEMLAVHPHRNAWSAVPSLCTDGARFFLQTLQAKGVTLPAALASFASGVGVVGAGGRYDAVPGASGGGGGAGGEPQAKEPAEQEREPEGDSCGGAAGAGVGSGTDSGTHDEEKAQYTAAD